jgi:hypothetical protein
LTSRRRSRCWPDRRQGRPARDLRVRHAEIEEARELVATDPVIVQGEMVAEYHKLYGSAAVMMINEVHNRIQKK